MAEMDDASKAESVDELIEKIRSLQDSKNVTVFCTYVEVKKKDFEKENRVGLKYQVNFTKLLENEWERLSKEEKKVYHELHSYQHELIDAKCELLTKQIIIKRKGERKYDGEPVSKRPKETTDDETQKIIFDPLFWYALDVHKLNSLKSIYHWKKDEKILKKNSADNWIKLSQDEQNQFINKAKEQRLLYYKDKTMSDSINTEAVFDILNKKMSKYKKLG